MREENASQQDLEAKRPAASLALRVATMDDMFHELSARDGADGDASTVVAQFKDGAMSMRCHGASPTLANMLLNGLFEHMPPEAVMAVCLKAIALSSAAEAPPRRPSEN